MAQGIENCYSCDPNICLQRCVTLGMQWKEYLHKLHGGVFVHVDAVSHIQPHGLWFQIYIGSLPKELQSGPKCNYAIVNKCVIGRVNKTSGKAGTGTEIFLSKQATWAHAYGHVTGKCVWCQSGSANKYTTKGVTKHQPSAGHNATYRLLLFWDECRRTGIMVGWEEHCMTSTGNYCVIIGSSHCVASQNCWAVSK